MEKRSFVNSIVPAAVVVVIMPLVVGVGALLGSFGLEVTGGSGMGMFGAMGLPHLLMLGWTLVAIAILIALVAQLVKDERQHA